MSPKEAREETLATYRAHEAKPFQGLKGYLAVTIENQAIWRGALPTLCRKKACVLRSFLIEETRGAFPRGFSIFNNKAGVFSPTARRIDP